MKCPRCQHVFSATPDAEGIVTCPSCTVRLRTRPAAAPAAPAAAPSAPAGPRPVPVAVPAPSKASAAPAEMPRAAPPPVEREDRAPEAALQPGPGLQTVLEELRAIREGQREILELLRQQPASSLPPPGGAVVPSFGSFDDERPAAVPAVRTRRRKTVLVIDDDPQTLQSVVEALERAEVPVRAVSDGNAGLAAIAEEKPDVLVMELGLRGSMAGKDVINMIKATMEWVDVPIVLHTRLPIENQREARQIHGADEYVLKGPDSAAALVSRVIAVFRRG